MSNPPKITLVGAGPGDPELISIKGMKAIQQADVILYDALIDNELLQYSKKDAIKICVGKRSNNHLFAQEEINRMLVAYAFNYGHVVRLKGGDPFVFGRGQEEKNYAEIFDIPVTVIPGISSAIAVPGNQGIALTKRGVSESFWVVTATTSHGKLSSDLALAAQSTATIVILMGVGKLAEIAELFQKFGKSEIPVAVIQNGTTAQERFVVGKMNTIVDQVEKEKIGTPAIIVVGEVVADHLRFKESIAEFALIHSNQ